MKNHQKRVITDLEITGMSAEGRGLGKVEGKVVFASFAVPGDVVDVEIRKSKKNYAEGVIAGIKSASALRVKPECTHFGLCGGCKWQHIGYAEQLKFKQQIVNDAFEKIGKLTYPAIPEVLGSAEQFFYRNKLEFAFTDRRWLTEEEISSGSTFEHRNGVGFHVPENFLGVIDVEKCHLQGGPSNAIRDAVRAFALTNGYSFFNLKHQTGLLRTMMVRSSSLGELLVLVSFTENDEVKISALLDHLKQQFPTITSLQYVINNKRNDTIYDLPVHTYSCKDFIIEQLGQYRFKIGAKSFFQTNSSQAKVLYDVTKNFAGLKGDEVVYDLYTGVGSIGIYLSDSCKTVTGIEQIEDAIKDARENAALNGVTNCTFYSGDVRMVLDQNFMAKNGKPDVVITDPPRAGMHADVVKTLLELEAPKIVYVSCSPQTQARDLSLLSEKYNIEKVQPVDMFPNTTHIENVAELIIK